MEINYDIIIKYLVTKKNSFASKKHILIYSDLFPEKFKDLIQNKFYRYGINQYDLKNNNISFYTSLLTLLNKEFITYNNDEELNSINIFKKSIMEAIDTFTFSNYTEELLNKNKINKTDILNTVDGLQLQCLSELLDINFIIFDFKEEKIRIIFKDDFCNPYKPTLLFANYEEYFEPVIYEVDSKKIFSYNDQYIKKLYQSDLESYSNKTYILEENIKNIINTFNGSNEQLNETFIKEPESIYSESQLLKMTKKDLQVILDKKNIKININKMLKKDIVNLIIN